MKVNKDLLFGGKNNDSAPKSKKLFNKNALKHGGLSVALTAIVLVVAIGVNLLFGFLGERFNLAIDISLQNANTLSEENIEFLKSIDKDVEIIICCAEDDYKNGSTFEYYVGEEYGIYDQTGSYFNQTLTLLGLYEKYSDKITITFADPYDPSFEEISKKYEATPPGYGDIIVEAFHTGEVNTVRNAMISFDDMYYVTEDSSYASYGYTTYYISGNKLETELTSAIYKATSAETKQALILGGHCSPTSATQYAEFLKLNNFDVETKSGSFDSISSDYDVVIIDNPTEDFFAEEIEAIDEWLYNGGLRGKGLIYFPALVSSETPNLDAFLEDWGVLYGDGVLYETADGYHAPNDHNTMYYSAADTNGEKNEFDKIIKANQTLYAGGARPLYNTYEEAGNRVTHPVVYTATDSVVIQDVSTINTNWEPEESAEQEKYIGILLTEDTEPVDNVYRTSYVMAFSTGDFVDSYWTSSYPAQREVMVSGAKFICGAEDDGVTFAMKEMTDKIFDTTIDNKTYKTFSAIFQWILPILTLACGIVVFIRRARR